MTSAAVTIYDNARHWVAQYESVDEVKEYRDKAVAIQAYARQANDYELESKAARARVRAEDRAGALLKELERKQGARNDLTSLDGATKSEYGRALEAANIDRVTASKWQQLAEVPRDEFEKALAESPTPSAHSILKARQQSEPPKRIDETALYFWGRLIDFEHKVFTRPLSELMDGMTPAMRADAERILPILGRWLRGSHDTTE